jgi:hypothetical protein
LVAAAYGFSESWIAVGFGILVAVAGFWFMPRKLFDEPLAKQWSRTFDRTCRELNVDRVHERFDVDNHSGEVTARARPTAAQSQGGGDWLGDKASRHR